LKCSSIEDFSKVRSSGDNEDIHRIQDAGREDYAEEETQMKGLLYMK
jgi:hypothetical protein